MAGTAANGQPAFVAYQAHGGGWAPHAVHVLAVDATGIGHVSVFLDAALCRLFAGVLGPGQGVH
jgi:hypothetical protein